MFRNDLSKSYSTAPQPGNPRATEAWALSQSALRMKAGQVSADRGEILAATRLNWRLWTILQSALLEPECSVPAELRNNMLSLARLVDKQTSTSSPSRCRTNSTC
jgi:flagellar protein FlaF